VTGQPARPRFRGSRKHVLDWVESPQFGVGLREMLQPVPVIIREPIVCVPAGHRDPAEAPFEIRNMAEIQAALGSTTKIMSVLLASIAGFVHAFSTPKDQTVS